VADATDNCAAVANAKQEDLDGDRQGDACDVDDDGDGLVDSADACHVLAARSLSGCPAFARKASFKFASRTKLSGKLAVSGKTRAPACLARQSVTLFRVKRGKDPAVGKPLTTSPKGTFALKKRLARGRYYATAKAATVGDVAECKAAKSKAVTRR
jgi:Thrombospondin type 3 repeat